MPKPLPPYEDFINTPIKEDGDFKLVEYIGKGCYALVFRGYSETLKQSVAYKVIPVANLAPNDSWKVEPQKANALLHPSVVRCNGYHDWREDKQLVVLKYDYVDGSSMHTFIRESKNQITIPFIKSFLKVMLGLFFELKQRGMQHGDFHTRNILVTKPSEYQLNATEEFKVTDFGVGGVTSDAELSDDYEQLARVLGQLLECIDYQAISAEEKYTYNILTDNFQGKHLIESDCTRDPLARNPEALLKYLDNIGSEYKQRQLTSKNAPLLTPFDYLSCEQVSQQHSLLHALYSDKFLGISEIESANNLVVTGPRGCGKSTVFRSLSLNQKPTPENGQHPLLTREYIGIYYHCNDLYFKFPRYTAPQEESAIDLPLDYLVSCLIIEVLDVLRSLVRTNDITIDNEINVSKELWAKLNLKRPSLPNADSFESLNSALLDKCQSTVKKYRTKEPVKRLLYGPENLLETCKFLQNKIQVISDKPFFCFIDDYSMPHISEELQKNLNRLFMHRNPICFFKMATESPVSYAASDIDDKHYIEGREFEVLNLGLTYLREETPRKLEFLDDVFIRRFKAVLNYPVASLEELIGTGDKSSQNEIAVKIADGKKTEWWGTSTFSSLCSGDIHQLITLARKMVSDSGGAEEIRKTEGIPKVKPKDQSKAIRTHAGDFLRSLGDSGDNGERLCQIISAFGKVANSYIKFKCSKNENGRPRHQAARIELREAPVFEGEAKALYDELIRYSIFIQDPRGKSFSGQLVPRLYLRRFLIPHFNLTFNRRDSLLMGVNDFRELILNPQAFEKRKTLMHEVADNYEELDTTQTSFDFQTEDSDE